MGIEREEILSKGMDNLFNNTIIEASPVLRKGGTFRYKSLSDHQTDRIKKKKHTDIL
jgi:hypothetical protein